MDGLFVLAQESRLRILQQAAARVSGCAYLCAWAPVAEGPASSSSSSSAATGTRLLRCQDAWLRDDGGSRGDGGRVRALFDAYRGSRCAAVSGCVPGWAYIDGCAYMELPARDLTASASLPQQQQFYQEAGIEMAAFMGCESGEIEVGMSTAAASGSSPVSLETSLQQVFSEDFFQQSLLEEFLHLPPSSPSSSLPSVSVDDSPAAEGSTSRLRTTTAVTSSAPTPSSGERQVPAPPQRHPAPPLAVPFGRHGYVHHFPSPEADDAAMAQAMLAVISAGTSSSSRRGGTRRTTAFRAYNAALAPRVPRRQPPGAPGQRMIKTGISILRRMHHMLRFSRERDAGAAVAQQRVHHDEEAAELQAPSSSQLNHMISERRRRERLNESFEALRGLLPPGSKKDKATVLAKTLEYMNILVSQISDLEARNRSLESRAHQRANGDSKELMQSSEPQAALQQGLSGSTSERVQLHVSSSASTSSRPQEVTVRVEVRAEGDVTELVSRVLAAIRETGRFTVVSIDARRPMSDGSAQATFTLRATQAGDLDEVSLKEAVMKAAEDSATAPSDDS